MHVLDRVDKISNDEKLIKLLAGRFTRKILSALQTNPKSIQQIVKKCNSSTVSVYRRIKELDSFGLLYVTGDISDDGKRKYYYQSKIKSYNLRFTDRETRIEITYNKRISKDFE